MGFPGQQSCRTHSMSCGVARGVRKGHRQRPRCCSPDARPGQASGAREGCPVTGTWGGTESRRPSRTGAVGREAPGAQRHAWVAGAPGLGVSRAPGGRPFPPRPRPRVAFLPASRPRPNVPLRQDAGRGFRTSSRLKLFAEARLPRGYAPGRGWGRGAGVSVAISGGRNSSHRRGLSPRSGCHRRLVHWPTPPEAGSRAWGWGSPKGLPNLGESP